jgi:hypothetical protein
MGDRIGPCPHIQGVGIGEKRRCPGFADGFNDLADKYRPDERGVALFPKVEFHGGDLFGGQYVFNAGSPDQPA